MALHIEDEFVAINGRARGDEIERCGAVKIEVAAARAVFCVSRVHAEERSGNTAGRNQEAATIKTEPLCIGICGLVRQQIGMMVHALKRNRREFTIGRRIELYRQTRTFGIVAIFHRGLHELMNQSMRTANWLLVRTSRAVVCRHEMKIIRVFCVSRAVLRSWSQTV